MAKVTRTDILIPGSEVKNFFALVLRLVLRIRSFCSTEYDIKTEFIKVRSLLSWIWSTYSNIIIYGVARNCFKMDNFRLLRSQTDLVWTQNTYHCKLHFIKQLSEGVKGVKSQIAHFVNKVDPV